MKAASDMGDERHLRQTLSLFQGTLLLLNIVIGAGLLILPGLVYQQVGLAAISSWLVCGMAAFPLLSVFIILGRYFPDPGGISHYALRAFGPLGQSIAAYLFLGAVVLGLPAIALTGSYYLSSVAGGSPHWYASLFVVFSACLHCVSGAKVSSVIGLVGSAVIFVVFGLIVMGAVGAWTTEASPLILLPPVIEPDVVLAPFMMIFFAFTGWEIGSNTAGEFKEPKKDFPWAMVLSFMTAMLLYVSIALVVQKANLTTHFEAPFIEIIRPVAGEYGTYLVAFVAVMLVFANLFGAIWGVSRMLYSLGRDGILPRFLSVTVDGTPLYGVLVAMSGILISIGLDYRGYLSIDVMLSLAGQNFLILYSVAAGALLLLSAERWTKLLSAFVIVLVSGLLLLVGVELLYPLALTVLSSCVSILQWRKGKMA